MYDVSVTHGSYILGQMFRYSAVVFAAPTYNAGIFINMENLLHDVKAHNLQNRTIALIDNGTWAATSGKQMKTELEKLKNCTFVEPIISVKSALKDEQLAAVEALADALVSAT